MITKQEKKVNTMIFWIALLGLTVLSFFVVRPFLIALVSAFILSYLVKPIYTKIESVSNKHISAILTIILSIGILIVPIILIGTSLVNQAQDSLDVTNIQSAIDNKIASLKIFERFNIDVIELKERVLEIIISIAGKTVTQIPSIAISLLIMVLATYYMLTNWSILVSKIKEFIPFKNKEKLVVEISKASKQIIFGYMLIASLEFVVAAIGFYIAGISNYLLLPALISMLAFIPGMGPGLVWIPTTLIMFFTGNIFAGVVILITGLTISLLIETMLYGKIIGDRASIHPLIMLIGILGGVPLFGVFGFIIGPLILTYTIKILEESISSK